MTIHTRTQLNHSFAPPIVVFLGPIQHPLRYDAEIGQEKIIILEMIQHDQAGIPYYSVRMIREIIQARH